MLKWFWTIFGYKSENDIKRDMILDYNYQIAKIYLEKDNEEAKTHKPVIKELSQKQKQQLKGWATSYADCVKKDMVRAQKGKKKKHDPIL